MNTNKSKLTEADFLVIAFIALAWVGISSYLFSIVPNTAIVIIGLICSTISISVYTYFGGLGSVQAEPVRQSKYSEPIKRQPTRSRRNSTLS